MANTYFLIEAKTLGSGLASVTFSSIPQTYTDLKLVMSMRSTGNLGSPNTYFDITTVSFNGSSSNFSQQQVYGNGSGSAIAGSASTLQIHCPGSGATASTFGNAEMYIADYTSSANKSMSVDLATENNSTNGITMFIAGLWSQTAAINSIGLTMYGGNIAEYSTFYLYGIKKD